MLLPVRFILMSSLFLFAASEVSVVRAQATEEAPAEPSADYDAAVDRGFDEFARSKYPEARAHFLEAAAIMPNARLSRALGMVEYELRNYTKAVEHLEQALRSGVRPLADQERAEASALLVRARDHVARYTVRAKPAHTRLFLDAGELQLAADHSVLLLPGDYLLEARAEGHHPLERKLHVVERADEVIALELQPIEAAAAPSLVAKSSPERRPSPPRDSTAFVESPWLWIGAGAALACVAIALAVTLNPSSEVDVGAPITTRQTPPGASIALLRGL
jgi:tetratricopeptide (TPR) repeat protein